MPAIEDLLRIKGPHLHTIHPSATVLMAVQKMNQHQIGALVVMINEKMVGMFTERDALRRVMAELRSPHEVTVAEVMTPDVICVAPDADVEEASRIMKEHRVRHLPVCAEGQLHGLISIGDLNAFYLAAHEHQISQLTDYIYGRV
jgi:CBS domain-containing protein